MRNESDVRCRQEALTGANRTFRVAAVGDMMFDRSLRPPRVIFHRPASMSNRLYGATDGVETFVNDVGTATWLSAHGLAIQDALVTAHATSSIPAPRSRTTMSSSPFDRIRRKLQEADFAFGNLECPLSDRGRPTRNEACYVASPAMAGCLADAGFKVLLFSNNHCLDFGDVAFEDTLAHLRRLGVKAVGAGRNLESARRPVVVRAGGLRAAFLAYNHVGPETVYAVDGECGVVPLNQYLLQEDLARARSEADVVLVSMHWGIEGSPVPTSFQRRFAHLAIDSGADGILGHHTHVFGAVEVYRGRPILYSLGNFVFGHTHHNWSPGLLAFLSIERSGISDIQLLPIGPDPYYPAQLDAAGGRNVLKMIQRLSADLGAEIAVSGQEGTLKLR